MKEERVLQENKDISDDYERKYIPGMRYYKFIGDDLIMIRLLRVKNENSFVVNANGTRYTMDKDEFSTYRRLNPDGYISYAIGDLEDGVQDVIVSFHRRIDLSTNKQLPFAVCRMNVYDIFSNTINQEEGVMYIGCSVSQESCPSDIEYPIMLACNGIHNIALTACYIEDTLDDILKLVNSAPYDGILYTLWSGYDKQKTRGVCKDLRELLTTNGFINDVYRGFNELKVGFKYIPELAGELIHAVEDIVKYQILDPIWIKFDRDVDLNAIKDQYLIIRDTENDLWIVSYKRGQYVNRPYFQMEDHTEYDVMKDKIDSKK